MTHAYKIYTYFSKTDYFPQQGTGFFVRSPHGENYFLTNAHVVLKDGIPFHSSLILHHNNGKRIENSYAEAVYLDSIYNSTNRIVYDKETEYSLILIDDIAILKLKNNTPTFETHPLALTIEKEGKTNKVQVGGFSKGIYQQIKGTYYNNSIQGTVVGSTPLKEGSSGSPVCNEKGEVLGIHHSTASRVNYFLSILHNDKEKISIQLTCNSPKKIKDPIVSFSMPTEKIFEFLKSSPFVTW